MSILLSFWITRVWFTVGCKSPWDLQTISLLLLTVFLLNFVHLALDVLMEGPKQTHTKLSLILHRKKKKTISFKQSFFFFFCLFVGKEGWLFLFNQSKLKQDLEFFAMKVSWANNWDSEQQSTKRWRWWSVSMLLCFSFCLWSFPPSLADWFDWPWTTNKCNSNDSSKSTSLLLVLLFKRQFLNQLSE